jgi:hypothetical protein
MDSAGSPASFFRDSFTGFLVYDFLEVMNFQIVFKDSPKDCESAQYIAGQPEWQRPQLQKFVSELLQSQRIDHPDARRLDGQKWSLWVRQEGRDAINHICYIARSDEPIMSDFARQLLSPDQDIKVRGQPPSMRLMIKAADPHAVSIGRSDEYLDPAHYASLMDSIQRDLFFQVIAAIKAGSPSEDYFVNGDGTFQVDINRPDIAYGVRIQFMAKWI